MTRLQDLAAQFLTAADQLATAGDPDIYEITALCDNAVAVVARRASELTPQPVETVEPVETADPQTQQHAEVLNSVEPATVETVQTIAPDSPIADNGAPIAPTVPVGEKPFSLVFLRDATGTVHLQACFDKRDLAENYVSAQVVEPWTSQIVDVTVTL